MYNIFTMAYTSQAVAAFLHHQEHPNDYETYDPVTAALGDYTTRSELVGMRNDVVDVCVYPAEDDPQFAYFVDKYADALVQVASDTYDFAKDYLTTHEIREFPEEGVDAGFAAHTISRLLRNEATERLALGELRYGEVTNAPRRLWQGHLKNGPLERLYASRGGNSLAEVTGRWQVSSERIYNAVSERTSRAQTISSLSSTVLHELVPPQVIAERSLFSQAVRERKAFEDEQGLFSQLLRK